MKNISIVIRNKNESRWIGHAIQSCLDNFFEPELIIINNQSSDESMEIVRSFRHNNALEPSIHNYCELVTANIDNYTPGKALNMGIKLAKNKFICIISAHTVIKKFDSEYILSNLKDFPCIFGKQIPIYRGKKITPRYIWSHFLDKDVVNMYSQLEGRYFLHNAYAIYTKDILEEYPFDEELSGKEDRLWAGKLIEEGKKILYTPRMEAEHHFTTAGNTWKGVG